MTLFDYWLWSGILSMILLTPLPYGKDISRVGALENLLLCAVIAAIFGGVLWAFLVIYYFNRLFGRRL